MSGQLGGSKAALKTAHPGTWLGTGPTVVTGPRQSGGVVQAGQCAQEFEIVTLANDVIAIRSEGKYVGVEPNGRMVVDRTVIDAESRFVVVVVDGKVALRNEESGYFISVRPNGQVACDSLEAETWELFDGAAHAFPLNP